MCNKVDRINKIKKLFEQKKIIIVLPKNDFIEELQKFELSDAAMAFKYALENRRQNEFS